MITFLLTSVEGGVVFGSIIGCAVVFIFINMAIKLVLNTNMSKERSFRHLYACQRNMSTSNIEASKNLIKLDIKGGILGNRLPNSKPKPPKLSDGTEFMDKQDWHFLNVVVHVTVSEKEMFGLSILSFFVGLASIFCATFGFGFSFSIYPNLYPWNWVLLAQFVLLMSLFHFLVAKIHRRTMFKWERFLDDLNIGWNPKGYHFYSERGLARKNLLFIDEIEGRFDTLCCIVVPKSGGQSKETQLPKVNSRTQKSESNEPSAPSIGIPGSISTPTQVEKEELPPPAYQV